MEDLISTLGADTSLWPQPGSRTDTYSTLSIPTGCVTTTCAALVRAYRPACGDPDLHCRRADAPRVAGKWTGVYPLSQILALMSGSALETIIQRALVRVVSDPGSSKHMPGIEEVGEAWMRQTHICIPGGKIQRVVPCPLIDCRTISSNQNSINRCILQHCSLGLVCGYCLGFSSVGGDSASKFHKHVNACTERNVHLLADLFPVQDPDDKSQDLDSQP